MIQSVVADEEAASGLNQHFAAAAIWLKGVSQAQQPFGSTLHGSRDVHWTTSQESVE